MTLEPHQPLRVLIADDEPLARQRLVDLLAHEPGVAVVGTAENGASAADAPSRTPQQTIMSDTRRDPTATPQPAGGDDEPVRYPENSVVGIIDTVENLSAAHTALTTGGFLASEIQVLCGNAAAEKLRANTGRTGLSNLAMRLVSAIGMPNDETALKNQYAEALHDGRFVVVVLAPTEERKNLAARVLQDHGGTSINFLGEYVIEQLGRQRGS